jgi:plasmid stability protein
MPTTVNLSIKGVPEELAQRVRTRARLNHRSLQGELMAMLEAHVGARPFRAFELLEAARAAGLETPDESTQWIREDRDSR